MGLLEMSQVSAAEEISMESQEDIPSVLSDEAEPEAEGKEEAAQKAPTALDGPAASKSYMVCRFRQ